MHGSEVNHDGETIFRGVKIPLPPCATHSLVINPQRLPADLNVSADGRRRHHVGAPPRNHIEGVQFHPESILTEEGKKLLKNFLDFIDRPCHEASLLPSKTFPLENPL
jgi:anthranilate/para-aminobenzoate synthase component II